MKAIKDIKVTGYEQVIGSSTLGSTADRSKRR